MQSTRFLLPVICGFLVAALLGCNEATSDAHADAHDHGHEHEHEHEHGHRPESLHAAVVELTEMRDAIRDAILDGEPNDAHDPLHEVGDLLEAIPDIAAETDLPKEEWDAVNTANEELFAAFGTIDKSFHVKDGDKQATYEEVAEKLDGAIEAIRSRLILTGEDPESEEEAHHEHDHDEHVHDEHDHHEESEDEHDHSEDHDHEDDEEGEDAS